jgi:Der1-like family
MLHNTVPPNMPAEINNINNQNGPTQWFQSLPIITQYWFGATVVLTLAGNFKVIDMMQFIWDWPSIRTNFELWRMLTCFCYAGPFELTTVFTVCTLPNLLANHRGLPSEANNTPNLL